MRLRETTLAGLFALVVCFVGPRATLADGLSKPQSKPSTAPAGLAMLVQSVVDTVLEHHIDPPARQQMILTGIQELYKAAGALSPRAIEPPRVGSDDHRATRALAR